MGGVNVGADPCVRPEKEIWIFVFKGKFLCRRGKKDRCDKICKS